MNLKLDLWRNFLNVFFVMKLTFVINTLYRLLLHTYNCRTYVLNNSQIMNSLSFSRSFFEFMWKLNLLVNCYCRLAATRNLSPKIMSLISSRRMASSGKEIKTEDEEKFEDDKPVKFSTSKASEHRPLDTFVVRKVPPPWYQPYCILFSISAFLLYFCVFREENDWDEEMGKSIFERIPGLKEHTEKAQRSTVEDIQDLAKKSDSKFHIVKKQSDWIKRDFIGGSWKMFVK